MNAQTNMKETAPRASSLGMIGTLGLVAMISGFLIVFVYEGTRERIALNQQRAIERAIFKVIPNAESRKTFAVHPDGLERVDDATLDGELVYGAYDANGQLVGVAIAAAAQGYQDVVSVLYGYSPEKHCITGMDVLKMTETPGLGDRIDKDPDFLANFAALDCSLNADKTALANAIQVVKHGTKSNAWEIDGISGATISSKAVGKMLNESAQRFAPFLDQHLDILKEES